MTPLFKAPTSVGKMQELFRQIRQNIAERTLADGPGYRTRHGPNGYHIELIKKPGGSESGTSPTSVSGGHPFQIYHINDTQRLSVPLPTGSHSWRRVYVRSGLVNLLGVNGTDTTEIPDERAVPQFSELGMEIEVPENTARYYIWIECVLGGASGLYNINIADIWHGTDPVADGWTDFPTTPYGDDENTMFFMIGYVDTATLYGTPGYDDNDPANEPRIRQYQRTDINCTPNDIMRLRDWTVCTTEGQQTAKFPSSTPF